MEFNLGGIHFKIGRIEFHLSKLNSTYLELNLTKRRYCIAIHVKEECNIKFEIVMIVLPYTIQK